MLTPYALGWLIIGVAAGAHANATAVRGQAVAMRRLNAELREGFNDECQL